LDVALTVSPTAGDKFTVKKSAPTAQFITGADGNYYFDLAAGTYQFDVVDALGRVPEAGPGATPQYKTSWTVTIDTTDNFTREAGGLNTSGGIEGGAGKYGEYNQLNFLLNSGPAPAQQIVVSGKVFTDVNGNGVQDPSDPASKGSQGFVAYVDANKSGQKEAGEQSVQINEDGTYRPTRTIPL
jgi:hypothetical protein